MVVTWTEPRAPVSVCSYVRMGACERECDVRTSSTLALAMTCRAAFDPPSGRAWAIHAAVRSSVRLPKASRLCIGGAVRSGLCHGAAGRRSLALPCLSALRHLHSTDCSAWGRYGAHSARATSSSHARRLSSPFTLDAKPSPTAIHASPPPLLLPLPLPPPPPFAIERNVHRA